MKLVTISVVILLTVFGIAAAGKRSVRPEAKHAVHGEWTGSFCIDNGPFVNEISLALDENSSITVVEGDKSWGTVSTGEFNVVGDSLVAKYIHLEGIQSPVYLHAIINKENKAITGEWSWIKGKGKIKLRLKEG